jgi:hypothetical protein
MCSCDETNKDYKKIVFINMKIGRDFPFFSHF